MSAKKSSSEWTLPEAEKALGLAVNQLLFAAVVCTRLRRQYPFVGTSLLVHGSAGGQAGPLLIMLAGGEKAKHVTNVITEFIPELPIQTIEVNFNELEDGV